MVELDSIVAENDRFMASRVAYLGRAGADSPPVPDDSLAFYLDTYSDFQIYNPSFGALSTLIAGGGLERVADPAEAEVGSQFVYIRAMFGKQPA